MQGLCFYFSTILHWNFANLITQAKPCDWRLAGAKQYPLSAISKGAQRETLHFRLLTLAGSRHFLEKLESE